MVSMVVVVGSCVRFRVLQFSSSQQPACKCCHWRFSQQHLAVLQQHRFAVLQHQAEGSAGLLQPEACCCCCYFDRAPHAAAMCSSNAFPGCRVLSHLKLPAKPQRCYDKYVCAHGTCLCCLERCVVDCVLLLHAGGPLQPV